jgi:hypothetical protein
MMKNEEGRFDAEARMKIMRQDVRKRRRKKS